MASFEVIEKAKKEAIEQGRAEGFEKGHREGLEIGQLEGQELGRKGAYDDASQKHDAALDEFKKDLESIKQRIDRAIVDWYEQSEQAMTDLAIDAVRALLQVELTTSRESALAIAKDALKHVTHSKKARIRLNPFDCALLKQHKGELLAAAGSLRDIEFVTDPVLLGGCVIETDGGVVDASLGTRLTLLQDELQRAA
jgi:flagellar assembly protein FliH